MLCWTIGSALLTTGCNKMITSPNMSNNDSKKSNGRKWNLIFIFIVFLALTHSWNVGHVKKSRRPPLLEPSIDYNNEVAPQFAGGFDANGKEVFKKVDDFDDDRLGDEDKENANEEEEDAEEDDDISRLDRHLIMRDVQKRLEKIRLNEYLKNLKKDLLRQEIVPFNNNADTDNDRISLYDDDDDDVNYDQPIKYLQSELASNLVGYPSNDQSNEISLAGNQPKRNKVEKRGRWQGFCFKRMRNRRRLPFICWRSSNR